MEYWIRWIFPVLTLTPLNLCSHDGMSAPPEDPGLSGLVFNLVDHNGIPTTNGSGVLIATKRGAEGVRGTVCDDGWNLAIADLVCKSMGYTCHSYWSSSGILTGAVIGEYPILIDDIDCPRSATHVTDCTFVHEHNCQPNENVVLGCDNFCEYEFSLVDGDGYPAVGVSGLLLAFKVGTNKNGTVCDDNFDSKAATLICNSMGYKCAASWRPQIEKLPIQSQRDIILDDITCNSANGTFIDSCFFRTVHNCGHSEDLYLSCECMEDLYSFQLQDEHGQVSTESGSGLLIAVDKESGDVGTVCDDSFTEMSAHRVCQSMGHSCVLWYENIANKDAVSVWKLLAQDMEILLTHIHCQDHSGGGLNECSFSKSTSSCNHEEDVFLYCGTEDQCSSNKIHFHLVDENNVNVTDSGSGLLIASRASLDNASGTVCDDGFSTTSARLICQEMGFSCSFGWKPALVATTVQSSYNIMLDDVICGRDNTTFTDCSWAVQNNCGHQEDVHLECANDCSYSFALLDEDGEESNSGSGLLFVTQSNGKSGTVCDDDFNDLAAGVICSDLGYSCSVYWRSQAYGKVDKDILLSNVHCGNTSQTFTDCEFSQDPVNCDHHEDVVLFCADNCSQKQTRTAKFKLVNGEKDDITHNAQGLLVATVHVWEGIELEGTVCDDSFDTITSDIICREMDFSCAHSFSSGLLFPEAQRSYNIVMDNVACAAGNDTDFARNCTFTDSHNCAHTEDIFLMCGHDCSGEIDGHVRFSLLDESGEFSRTGSGLLLATTVNTRGTVCDDQFTDYSAHAICKQMGYPCANGFSSGELTWGVNLGLTIALDNVACRGPYWAQCDFQFSHNCDHSEDVFLTCSDSCFGGRGWRVQLLDENGILTSHFGLALVSSYVEDISGTVCNNNFTLNDGHVFCKSAGYSCAMGVSSVGEMYFHEDSYPIAMDNVKCAEGGGNLTQCTYNLNNNCSRHDQVVLMCGGERNIAKAGVATQSDDYPGMSAAWLAIDGDRNGNYFSGSVSHTNSIGEAAWWKLTWDQPMLVEQVKIFNRADCCQERLIGARIQINGSTIHTSTLTDQLMGVFVLDIELMEAREILITASTDNYLTLAEVEVYGPHSAPECPVTFSLLNEDETVAARSGLLMASRPAYIGVTMGTVCNGNFSQTDGDVICKSLGFNCASHWSSADRWDIQQRSRPLLDNIECPSSDAQFSQCRFNDAAPASCTASQNLFLTCGSKCNKHTMGYRFYFVDEQGDVAPNEGLLIAEAETWDRLPGTVCDDGFNETSATVICREMGFTCSRGVYKEQWMDVQVTYNIMLDDVMCAHENLSFTECSFSRGGFKCAHSEDVFLRCGDKCDPAEFTFSLMDTDTGNDVTQSGKGLLIATQEGTDTGGTVCDDSFTLHSATLFCGRMGFACARDWHVARPPSSEHQTSLDIVMDDVMCPVNATDFAECSFSMGHNCAHIEDVFLTCKHTVAECERKDTYQFRLIDGNMNNVTSSGTGLLIARSEDSETEGTVCDDRLNETTADIICREMGFRCATTWYTTYDVPVIANLSIVLDNVECSSTAQSFTDCSYNNNHDCTRNEDVHLICQNACKGQPFAFFLVDKDGHQTTAGEGLVIVNTMKSGQRLYGTVCGDGFNDNAAAVICKQMGHDHAVSWTVKTFNGIQLMYLPILNSVSCTTADQEFNDCRYQVNHTCTNDLYLQCDRTAPYSKFMCPPGSQYDDNDGTCEPCPRDMFKTLYDDTACDRCPDDSFSNEGATSCITCPSDGQVVGGRCICPPGQQIDYVNGVCEACPPNTFHSPHTTTCHGCPEDSVSQGGAVACLCGVGRAWAEQDCMACPGGSVSGTDSNECVACPQGVPTSVDNAYCLCGTGYYWDSATCAPCPPGMFSDTVGSLSCQPCPVFTFSVEGATACEGCQEGEAWRNGACGACPDGYYGDGVKCISVEDPKFAEAVKAVRLNSRSWLWPVCVLLVVSVICVVLGVAVVRLRRKVRVLQRVPYGMDIVEGDDEFVVMSYEPRVVESSADNVQLLPASAD